MHYPLRMGALTNQRQERFCQLVKQGVPPFKAYPLAGYKPHNGAPYRLRENVRVKRRLAELTRGLAMKTRVTVETITRELDEARDLAKRTEQPAAMTAAITAKARLHGLLIDRKEIGAPRDFDDLETEREVMEAFRNEHGDDAAQLLVKLLAGAEKPPELLQDQAIELVKSGETIN